MKNTKNCCCEELVLIRNNLYTTNSGYYHQAQDCYGPENIITTSGNITAYGPPSTNNWYSLYEEFNSNSSSSTVTRRHDTLNDHIKISGTLILENFKPYKLFIDGDARWVRGIGSTPTNFSREISYTGNIPYSYNEEVFNNGYTSIQLPVGNVATRTWSLVPKTGIYASDTNAFSLAYFTVPSSRLSPPYSGMQFLPCFVGDPLYANSGLVYDPQPLWGYNIIGPYNNKSGIISILTYADQLKIIKDPIITDLNPSPFIASRNQITDNSLSIEFYPFSSISGGYITSHSIRRSPVLNNILYYNNSNISVSDRLGISPASSYSYYDYISRPGYVHSSGRSLYAIRGYTNTNISYLYGSSSDINRILLYKLYDHNNVLDSSCNVSGVLVLDQIRPTPAQAQAATTGDGSYLIVNINDEASFDPTTTYPNKYWKNKLLLKDYSSFVVDKTKPVVSIQPLDDIFSTTSTSIRNNIVTCTAQVSRTETLLKNYRGPDVTPEILSSRPRMYYSGIPLTLSAGIYTLSPQWDEYNDEIGQIQIVTDRAGNTIQNNLSYQWTIHQRPSDNRLGAKPLVVIDGQPRLTDQTTGFVSIPGSLISTDYLVNPRSITDPVTKINLIFDRAIDPSGINNSQITLTKNGVPISGCNIISKDSSNKNFIIQVPYTDQTSRSHWFLTYNPSGLFTKDGTIECVTNFQALPSINNIRSNVVYQTCDSGIYYRYISASGGWTIADPYSSGFPHYPEPCVLASRVAWIMEDSNPAPELVDTTYNLQTIGFYTSVGGIVEEDYNSNIINKSTNITQDGGIFINSNFIQDSVSSDANVIQTISCNNGTQQGSSQSLRDIGSICTWNSTLSNRSIPFSTNNFWELISAFPRFPKSYGTLSNINIAATGYFYGNPGFSITNNKSYPITISGASGNLELSFLGDNYCSNIIVSGNLVNLNITPPIGTTIAPNTTQNFIFTNIASQYSNITTTDLISSSECFIRTTENAPTVKIKTSVNLYIDVDNKIYTVSDSNKSIYDNKSNIIITSYNGLYSLTRLGLQYIYNSSGKVLQFIDSKLSDYLGIFTEKPSTGYTPSVTPISGDATGGDCSYFNLITTIDPAMPKILGSCKAPHSIQKHASSIRCSGDIIGITTELLALDKSGNPLLPLYTDCMCTQFPDSYIRLSDTNFSINYFPFNSNPLIKQSISGYTFTTCDYRGYDSLAFLYNNPISYTGSSNISQNVWIDNNYNNNNIKIRPWYITSGIFLYESAPLGLIAFAGKPSGTYITFRDEFIYTSGEYASLGSPSGGSPLSESPNYTGLFRRYDGDYTLQDLNSTISSTRLAKEFINLGTTTLGELVWEINNYLTIHANINYINKQLPSTISGIVTSVSTFFSGTDIYYTVGAKFAVNDSEMVSVGTSGNYQRILYDAAHMGVIFSKEKEDAFASGQNVYIPFTYPVQQYIPNYWLKIQKL